MIPSAERTILTGPWEGSKNIFMVVPIIALVVTTGINIRTRKSDLRRKIFQFKSRATPREKKNRMGSTMIKKRKVTERLFQKKGSEKSSTKLSSPVKEPFL
jgi:hypothetical protein